MWISGNFRMSAGLLRRTTTHLLAEMALVVGLLLAAFFVIDSYLYRKDGHSPPDPTPDNPLRVSGVVNFVLMGVIIGALLFSATFKLGGVDVLALGSR
jgi:hypothetical protein